MSNSKYPAAIDPSLVGEYPALSGAGGGYVWTDVLEYRVWICPSEGGSDYYYVFETYEEAEACAERKDDVQMIAVLIRQKQYIEEEEPGKFSLVEKERITEWRPEWLTSHRNTHKVDIKKVLEELRNGVETTT